ncbi:ABC transporter substrate-binding protein [Chitinimonas sp. BJB300]|uniref:ABC transporter substrate-binding protein n=1 Tax=Chitinimonas sp. BJB300 TaxID=1559339 RepID=UPI000C0FF41F|nr:ABC transporter substrate-binding protein [Chitinimonas sp. BJB300]PHV13404.1 ABC transporter [Chitinimonas sp. BJB300]TSJ89724.1 substrate-binding domain-containing protein [Chitinimonas sp. BJB300]
MFKIFYSHLRRQALLVLCLLIASPASLAGSLGVIGIEASSLANPFFQALVRGIVHYARVVDPAVEVVTLQNEYDSQRNQSNLDQLLTRKVRVLFLNAASTTDIGPMIAQARMAGIIVIAVDVAAEGAHATVMTDNLLAGQIACDYLARSMQGRGKVAIQTGPDVSSVRERVSGCKQAWLRYPDIQLVPGDYNGKGSPAGGRSAMAQILKADPAVKGVFTINDRQAVGSDKALSDAGRKDVFLISVDGSPEIADLMRRKPKVLGSSKQDPYAMAQKAVELAVTFLAGKTVPQTTIHLKPTLLTQDNLDDYQGWEIEPPK